MDISQRATSLEDSLEEFQGLFARPQSFLPCGLNLAQFGMAVERVDRLDQLVLSIRINRRQRGLGDQGDRVTIIELIEKVSCF